MLRSARVAGLLALVGCAVAGTVAPASAGAPVQPPVGVLADRAVRAGDPPDLLTLRLASPRSAQATQALTRVVERLGGEVRSSAAASAQVLVPADRTAGAVAALSRVLGVQGVDVAAVLRPAYVPDDPRLARQDYLDAVRLTAAWDRSRGSSATLAVLDTGVAVTHPDLADKIVGRYNAVPGVTNKSDVTDQVGHGTAVTGVAAAATDNGRGIAGAGFATKVLAVKVAVPGTSGVIYGPDLANGIRWATDQGADVINMSLGGPTSDRAMRDAVRYALDRDVVLVAAAGNEGDTEPSYPAALDGVIAVGATEGRDRAWFSTYGQWVDVAAPGADIYTTTNPATTAGGSSYGWWSGTSFASPIVAGQVALLRAQRPKATASRIEGVIERSATRVAAYAFAHGRVDVRGSLDWLLGAPATAPRAAVGFPGDRSALVSWRPPAVLYGGTVGRYRLEVRGADGRWTYAASVRGPGLSGRVDGLRNGRSYELRVRAVTQFGVGAPSATVRVRVGVPTSPRALALTTQGRRVTATWDRPAFVAAGVSGYRVEWRPLGDSTWRPVDRPASPRAWTSPRLVRGERYEVRVRALNTYGSSAASAVKRAAVPR